MSEVVGLRLPLNTDLAQFSSLLWQVSIPHRIAEERGMQVVWFASESHAGQARALYEGLQTGEVDIQPVMREQTSTLGSSDTWYRRLSSVPVIAVLLVLSLLGALLPVLDRNFQYLSYLSFYQLYIVDGTLRGDWPVGQLWRVITPAFLHFGFMHIVFNSLWLWELGGMIERRQGAVRIIGIFVLVAAGSNIAQAMSSVSLFGGMSGVIYGLLGYIVVWNRMRPEQAFPLVKGVAIVMLVWLLLCIAGFTELLGVGAVANTAHVSGLVLGLILGFAAALLDRKPG
ncbi:Rhomboid protease GlpG [Zhongshania aliphaticivorans]|uniref:Rhomboid protease GlpG n=1 Tax=Zhongshania aliphaticivorans TaxID=1470434 RepID=A0A5S9NAE9_9GAMM|nr:rhomboid family intramembrane serine protease [Zhongshania aliphaticivorans]CAA0087129.1 Rhomboid protease GlpG [Zhongshania aliphaticivorans]CAA0114109.1 Rhomboid protease GlpG [Zhongshania aliphaticivorans]